MALLFLGVCQFLSLDFWQSGWSEYTNIYISIFAPVTALMMFLSIISYDNDNLKNKIFGIVAFISGMMLIVESNIRLSWVVFVVLVIVVFFLMFKKTAVNKFSIIMFTIFIGVFTYFITTNITLNDRINNAYIGVVDWERGVNLDSSVGLRLEIYSSALKAAKEKPYFGYGYRNGPSVASKYADLRVKNIIYNLGQLHSEYVTTLIEKGLFGLLSLGMLLLSPVLIIVRNYSKDDIYIRIGVISSISFVFFGIFNTSFGDTTIKAFFVLLICLFLPNILKRKSLSRVF